MTGAGLGQRVSATTRRITREFDVTGAPMVLNAGNLPSVMFTPSDDIGAAKTWSFTNVVRGSIHPFSFTITGEYAQTFTGAKMSDAGFDNATKIWLPNGVFGLYRGEAQKDANDVLFIKILGPENA